MNINEQVNAQLSLAPTVKVIGLNGSAHASAHTLWYRMRVSGRLARCKTRSNKLLRRIPV